MANSYKLLLSYISLLIVICKADAAIGTLSAFAVLDHDHHCNVSVEIEQVKNTVTINMTGPHDQWFGVGFGNTTGCPVCMNNTYAIVCRGAEDGKNVCQENVLSMNGYGKKLKSSIKIQSITHKDHVRYVSITRKIMGDGDDYFSFPLKASAMDIIHAIGKDAKFEEKTAHMGPGGYMKLNLK